MSQSESGAKFIIGTRVSFFHELKGLANLLDRVKVGGSDLKLKVGFKACRLVSNYALALQFSDRDMPNSESEAEYNLFIIEGYQARSLLGDLHEDMRDADLLGGRETIIDGFYGDAKEIVERAVLRYHRIYSAIKPAAWADLENFQKLKSLIS